MPSTQTLVQKLEKLSAKKGDSMDLYFAAEELRELAGKDKKLLAVALRAHRKAAERDNPNAALAAGLMVLHGQGTETDLEDALALFERGADGGNWDAALRAARMHYYHTRKYQAARRFAEAAAHESNPDAGAANYLLGLMAGNGYGEPKDDKRALKLQQKAAKQGNADAMFELYVLLSTGQGAAKDEAAALKWNQKAADLGQHRACYNIGAFHATGRGVKKDMALAVSWYQRAADAGNGQAAATLAAMMLAEKGPQGAEESIPFIARALELEYDVGGLLAKMGIPASIVDKLLAIASDASP